MSEYKNLHERLLEEGYVTEAIIEDKNLCDGLTALALEVARGKYKSVRLLPANILLAEKKNAEEMLISEPSQVVYVVLGDVERNLRGNGGMCLYLKCTHKPTGEDGLFLKL